MRGWEMRGRILIMQSEGDEGGICVVAESCHQTSGGIGLMASVTRRRTEHTFKYRECVYPLASGHAGCLIRASTGDGRPPRITGY
jgi:hypothetical protein